MRCLLAITASTLLLTGCVTENSYNGSNKPVVENAVNNVGAARTRIALALQYLDTGNNSQAKYNLERASEFAPNLPEVHYSFAYYYQQVGENVLADKAYQKAIKIDPNDPNTRNNYGVFLCGINEYDRATDQLLKAIAIPSYIRVAESYENLALCAIEFDDFENAESYLKSAINHSSQRPSSIINLAALYYAKSDLHKAEELIKRYESTGKVSSRSLLLEYLIEQRMGHIEKAETTAAIILQTYPTSNQATLIREQKTKRSEFELLREQYRKAQLDELQAQSPEGVISAEPKIRIIKKKKTSTAVVATEVQAKKNDPRSEAASKSEVTPQVESTQTDVPASNEIQPVDTGTIIAALSALEVAGKAALETQQQTATAQATNAVATEPATPTANTSQSKDGVKIISFGAPTTAATTSNTNNPSQAATKSASQGKVVFYEPEKNAQVFQNQARSLSEQQSVHFQGSAQPNQVPMLNPQLAQIKVPYHIMQDGENLFSISVRYNVKLQKLLQWNGLKESDRINNGTKVFLNDPHIFYEINEGDTLYSIATQRRLLIDQLMRWNKLSPDDSLKAGHRLLLVDPDSYAL
ncbi:type IV pilus biogenesis/stability protein PilW [Pseudoalteromonas sp.]|uniref:type IV pilus biogenesis/stability protein PilW n=1 Tax=unclassified Pseudoalteromonas TaxID=194690 RepID=UPI003F9903F2